MPIHKFFFYLFLLALPTQLGKHFWPEWSHVWGLRIDYLAPTIYVSDILLGITLIAWASKFIVGKVQRYRGTKVQSRKQKKLPNCLAVKLPSCLLVLALVFALVFQFLRVPHPYLWLYKVAKLAELGLLGVYVAKTTKTKADFKRIINLLLIGAVFESGLAIAQFVKQGSLGGIFWWLGERTFNINTPGIAKIALRNPLDYSQSLILRPYATFSHPNSLAGYLLVVLILTFLNLKSKILPLSIMLVALLLAFSRSAWLVGLILFSGYIILRVTPLCGGIEKFKSRGSRLYSNNKKTLLTSILLIFILYTLYYILYTSTISDPQNLQKRWQLTLASWKMVKSSPLTGIGLGHFIPKLIEFPQKGFIYWLQPVHNIFLLLAAEGGLVGLGIFLRVLGMTYKKLRYEIRDTGYPAKRDPAPRDVIRNMKKEQHITYHTLPAGRQVSLITALTAILLLGMFDHYWLTLQQNQLLFALVLGLGWANFKPKS